MKKWLLALAFCLFATGASAQCSGTVPNNYVCGNLSGAQNVYAGYPLPVITSAQLDTICSTNGDTLLRTSGTWGCNGTNPISWLGNQYFATGYPWCDPRAYGAVGDHVTDDSAAFASCVTQLTATGGILYVPPGNYLTSSGVTITGSISISIVCAQYDSTEIQVGSADVTVITLNNAAHEIHNCLLKGSNTINTTHDLISLGASCTECNIDRVFGVYGRYAINIAAGDVRISNVNLGTTLGAAVIYSTGSFSCSACKLDGSYPISTPAQGTTFAAWQSTHLYSSVGTVVSTAGSQAGSTYLLQLKTSGTTGGSAPTLPIFGASVTDGTAVWQLVGQATSAAVQADTGSSTVVIGNRSDLSGPYTYGLYLSGNSQTLTLTDSFIGAVYNYGVYDASSAGGINIHGNNISNCINVGCIGVYVHGAPDVTISDNNLVSDQIGIAVDTTAKNVSIVGNEISNAAIEAIGIAASATQVSVVGNNVSGGGTWGVNTLGVLLGISTDYITVLGNQCHGATTCLTNSSTGQHNFIESTPGVITLNTISVSSITLNNGTALTAYVAGAWTPVITTDATVGTPAYTTQLGTYEQIGRQITARFNILLSGWAGSPTGNVSIAGLPVVDVGNYGTCTVSYYTGANLVNAASGISGIIADSVSAITLYSAQNTSTIKLTTASLGTTGGLAGWCNYHS